MTYGVFGMSFFCSAYFLWMGIENIYIHKKTFETDVDEIVYKIDYIIAPLIIVFFTTYYPSFFTKRKSKLLPFLPRLPVFSFLYFGLLTLESG